MLPIIRCTDKKALKRLLKARQTRLRDTEVIVRRIVEDVRRQGDRALHGYAQRFDGLDLKRLGFTVTRGEIESAYDEVPKTVVKALRVATRNIRSAAKRQLPRPWQTANGAGIRVGQIVRPLERVACYVPGGRFPLPSTVLMSVIPAQVAGVREILITSPRPAPVILVTADLLEISRIFRLGGAQAIAAFAYGTASVPQVDKIVGPGNRYVAAAKKLVAGDCGIDFVAGPSEVVMVGEQGCAEWIAADLVAQAEHDPDAVAILITPSRRLALEVQASAGAIVQRLRLPVAGRSLVRQGGIIVTQDLPEAVELANRFAPEHLVLLEGADKMLNRIQSAGSIFLGGYSPVAAGDYASGTNHILPTAGVARLRGGLSAADFVKTISYQRLSRQGLARLQSTIETLANAEGLTGHAYSVETRFKVDDPTA